MQIIRGAAKGNVPMHQVPKDLRSDAINAQGRRQQAQNRLDRMKATSDLANTPSTPERVQARAAMSKLKESDPRMFDAKMQYAKMPHAAEHQGALDAAKNTAGLEYAQRDNDVLKSTNERLLGLKPLPKDYDAGKARAAANYSVANPWLQHAPLGAALVGGAAGALTADESQGEDRLTRGLLGAAGGAGLGMAARHGLPHAMGAMQNHNQA